MKQYLFFLLVFVSVFSWAQSGKLENGDLIFQEGCSDGVSAIKEVTNSIDQYQFTHVGMVYIDEKGSIYVLEATHPQVVLTPLSDYLYPENVNGCYPRSVVGRLREEYQPLIPKALIEGMKLLGKAYDYGYIPDNDMYYCSELVYDILKKANEGEEVFPLNTMTFKSSETGMFTDGWIQYFKKLNMPIPEGEKGINPGAMSTSNIINIIFNFD